MADGSITATIDIDDKDAQKELKKLHEKISNLEFDTKVKESTKKRLESELAAITEAQKRINPNDDAAQKEMESRYDAAQKRLDSITEALKQNADVLGVAQAEADKYAEALAPTQEYGYLNWTAELGNALAGVTKKALELGAAIAYSVVRGVKNLSVAVVKAVANMNVFHKIAKKIAPVFHRISRLATRVFFFSVITSGLRALRKTMSEWLSKNAEFSAALGRLKGAMATAFEPIYSAVIPALTSLLNMLTQVIAAIAQFNAFLFGKTAKQAQDNAKALTEQADATKKAGGAASKAAKQLANFDEINKLSDSSGGGGGGGGETATVPTFDFEVEDIGDWGKALSDLLDRIIAKLRGLADVIPGLVAKINDKIKQLLEMLTYPGLSEKMYEIGKLLAEALNEIVAGIDWYSLGAALGAGLQLAISFLVGFIYNFDWIQLGTALGTMINGMVSKINWYQVGMLLWAGWKIALETLAGFILGLDMPQLAKAASNIAKGFFDSITETLEKINWKQIGKQIATFLQNIDWSGVAKSCFTAIGSAFGAAASFLWGFIQGAWGKVVKWWHDNAIKDGEFTMEGLLEGIKNVFVGIYNWLKTNVFEPFWNGFRKLFQINSPSKVMQEQGEYIAEGILVGILSVFSGIRDWLKTNVFEPIWNGLRLLFGINGNNSTKMREVGMALSTGIASGITSAIQKVKNALNSIITLVENAVNWMIDKVNSISIDIPDPFGGEGLHIGFNVPRLTIPRLAQGAVIPPNREFLAVLGDQKSGTNIEAPLDTIVQAFRQVMGNSKKEIILTLDRRELGRAVVDVASLESQRVGLKLGGTT